MEVFDIAVLRGDTWSGLGLTVTLNGSALDLTGAAIDMQVRRNYNDNPHISFSTARDSIRIINPTGGVFNVLPAIIDCAPGSFNYDIQIVTNTGRVITPLRGAFSINPDITR